jgi:hypothetical protein
MIILTWESWVMCKAWPGRMHLRVGPDRAYCWPAAKDSKDLSLRILDHPPVLR